MVKSNGLGTGSKFSFTMQMDKIQDELDQGPRQDYQIEEEDSEAANDSVNVSHSVSSGLLNSERQLREFLPKEDLKLFFPDEQPDSSKGKKTKPPQKRHEQKFDTGNLAATQQLLVPIVELIEKDSPLVLVVDDEPMNIFVV